MEVSRRAGENNVRTVITFIPFYFTFFHLINLFFYRAFEEYIKKLDKDDFLARKKERQRIERKRREEFTLLVSQLLESRQFTAQNPWKWSLFVSKYKDDKRYLDLVG